MKTAMFLLCSLSVGLGFQWDLPQPVQDTPEVAAAKSAHLKAIAKAKNPANPWTRVGAENDGSWKHYDDGSWKDDGSWNDDGSWEEDSGVWNHGSSAAHWDDQEKKWTGPIALPPGYDKNGAPLPVQDTPEVAAAKSKHYHLYHKAAAQAAPPTRGAWHH